MIVCCLLLKDLTVFFFIKDFEMGGLRCMDAKNFGCIVKKCLGLPNTVRQCDISVYVLLSHSFLSVLSVSPFFAIKDKPLQFPD